MQRGKVKSYIDKHGLFNRDETVVVAVSGGPDSLCLLHLLCGMQGELNIKLVAAHLNHGLRPEASFEALGVENIARAWSIPFEKKEVNIRAYKKELGLSEEEAGRKARYDFFFATARKYNASAIALGHHFDDQAETVLLNVIRGTGVDGLAGILPKRSRGKFKLVRPLLCLRRSDIEAYCRTNNLHPFTDSSNLETDYTRNRLRLELIPMLEEFFNPRIKEALCNLATLALNDRKLLQALAYKKYKQLARFNKDETIIDGKDLLALPSALQGRALRFALKRFAPLKKINRRHIDQLIDLLKQGKTGRMITLPGRIKAHYSYGKLVLSVGKAVSQKEYTALDLAIPGRISLPGGRVITARVVDAGKLSWPPHPCQAYLDFDKLAQHPLKVRWRWPGARFYPQGSGGSKKLKDFFIDQKIPASRRDFLPLVVFREEIVWVAGVRIAEPYRLREETCRVLILEYKVLRRINRRAANRGRGDN